MIDKQEIENLRKELERLKKENFELTVENGKYKNSFGNIKERPGVTRDNMELIKTIDKYEKFLFAHGYDINDIK